MTWSTAETTSFEWPKQNKKLSLEETIEKIKAVKPYLIPQHYILRYQKQQDQTYSGANTYKADFYGKGWTTLQELVQYKLNRLGNPVIIRANLEPGVKGQTVPGSGVIWISYDVLDSEHKIAEVLNHEADHNLHPGLSEGQIRELTRAVLPKEQRHFH